MAPLLFLCYLKGLPTSVSVNGKIYLFADDTNLLITEDDLNQLELSSFISLSSLAQRLNHNNLIENFQKTQFMQFYTKRATAGRPNYKIRISINNNKLCHKDNLNFLD